VYRAFVAVCIGLVLSALPAAASDDGLKAELARLAVPLQNAALEKFAAAIGDSNVVGLGEASHGTREDVAFKTRVFEYLVLHRGFSIFAIEGDWSEWLPMDAYVNGGPGDPASMLKHQDFSIFRIRELVPILKWMRAYNARHPATLHIAGIDAQEPERTIGIAAAYARAHVPAAAGDLEAASTCFRDAARFGPVKLTQQQVDDCSNALTSAASKISALATAASPEASRASTAIGYLQRSAAMYVHHSSLSNALMNTRDATMAANVAYLAREAYPGAKIVVSAEDMHVAVEDAVWPDWVTMGAGLRATFGKRYYATDVLFHSGLILVKTAAGLDVKPQAVAIAGFGDEIGSLFAELHIPFYMDLRRIEPESTFGAWMSREHTQWTFGGVVDPDDVYNAGATHLVLARSFDGLFFFPTSTPTTPL
jgi:erythromycin esterase